MHALFGMAIPISKMLLKYTTPIFFTGVRISIAGLLLLAYQLLCVRKKVTFCRKNLIMYGQAIFFGAYITYILRFWGLSQISSIKTAFLFNTSPFFTALYAYVMEKERLSHMQWIGLCLGFVGILPILLTTCTHENLFGELCIFSWAELAVLLSVAAHCYSWMIIRRLIRLEGHKPTFINGICLTFGGILALITSIFMESIPHIVDLGYFISWLMIVILLSNLISHNIYGYLLDKHYSATFLSFTNFLGPLFTACYGWVFLNEQITWHFSLSLCLVFFGLYLFYYHELQVTKSVKFLKI